MFLKIGGCQCIFADTFLRKMISRKSAEAGQKVAHFSSTAEPLCLENAKRETFPTKRQHCVLCGFFVSTGLTVVVTEKVRAVDPPLGTFKFVCYICNPIEHEILQISFFRFVSFAILHCFQPNIL